MASAPQAPRPTASRPAPPDAYTRGISARAIARAGQIGPTPRRWLPAVSSLQAAQGTLLLLAAASTSTALGYGLSRYREEAFASQQQWLWHLGIWTLAGHWGLAARHGQALLQQTSGHRENFAVLQFDAWMAHGLWPTPSAGDQEAIIAHIISAQTHYNRAFAGCRTSIGSDRSELSFGLVAQAKAHLLLARGCVTDRSLTVAEALMRDERGCREAEAARQAVALLRANPQLVAALGAIGISLSRLTAMGPQQGACLGLVAALSLPALLFWWQLGTLEASVTKDVRRRCHLEQRMHAAWQGGAELHDDLA